MGRRTFLKTVPAFTVLAGTASSFAEDLKTITLVKPQTDGGKSVLFVSPFDFAQGRPCAVMTNGRFDEVFRPWVYAFFS